MARPVEFTFIGNNRSAVAAAHGTSTALDEVGRSATRASATTQTGMSGVQKSVAQTASRIESSLISTLRRATFIAGGLATTVGGFATAMGLSFYRTQQSASIAFTTILKDGGKARKFLGELAAFAAKTPFEFPDLLRTSQRLLNAGFQAKQIIPIMTDVGNAVAGAGGDPQVLDATVRAIGQIQAKGRLMAEEMMQLNEAGTFSWNALAHAIGKSVPEAMDLVTKGAVSADAFIAAFQQNSQERFANLMEKQSHTFTGLLSTFKDNVSQTMSVVMTPFFVAMEKGFAGMNERMSTPAFQNSIKQWGERSSQALQDAWAWIIKNRDEIADLGRDGFNAGKQLAGALADVVRVLNRIQDLVGGWGNLFMLLLSGRLALAVLGLEKAFTRLAGTEAAAGAAGGTGIAAAGSRAAFLLRTMQTLAKLGTITLLVEVIMNKDDVDRIGNWLDSKLGLRNFFGSGKPGGVDWKVGRAGNRVFLPEGSKPVYPVPKGASQGIIGTPHAGTHAQSDWQSANAIDIAAAPGTPVLAPQDGHIVRVSGRDPDQGTVRTSSGKNLFGYGVTLQAFRGGTTYYFAHLDDVTVSAGDKVARGQTIGFVAHWKGGRAHVHAAVNTGNATSIFGGMGQATGATPEKGGGVGPRGAPGASSRDATDAAAAMGVDPKTLLTAGRSTGTAKKENPLVAMARAAAEKYGIPPELFFALISQESGWNPNARSGAGAAGLTQLMPGTARGLGVRNVLDPRQNLMGGAKYLAQQFKQFGSWELALAAYNAGPGNVRAAGNQIPNIRETQDYVRQVLARAQRGGGAPGTTPSAMGTTPDPADTLGVQRMRNTINWITDNIDRITGPARDAILVQARKISQSISRIVTKEDQDRVSDRVKSLVDRFSKTVNEQLGKARSSFDTAWGKFKDKIAEAFDKIANIYDELRSYGESELERARTQNEAGAAQGIIDAALAVPEGERSTIDQQILEAGQGRVGAIKAYWAAIQSGSKQAITEAARALVAAENHWASIIGGAGEGNPLVSAFETLFGTTGKKGEEDTEMLAGMWKGLTEEAAGRAEALVDEVGKKLASGKITWQQARDTLFSGLKDMGVDVNTIGDVLGGTFQGALIEAVNEVTTAVEELIRTIRRLRGETANPITGPKEGGSRGGKESQPRFLAFSGEAIGFTTVPGVAAANTVTSGIQATAPSPVIPMTSVVGSQQVAAFRAPSAAAPTPISISAPVTVQGNVRSDTDLSAAIAESIRDETIRIANRLGGGGGGLYARSM